MGEMDVPDDAGEYADALAAILRRIPEHWGRSISCGPGWYPIVARLDSDLAALDPGYAVQQVKEKFGGLRYYAEPQSACEDRVRFDDRIARAEDDAARTCELCGAPGNLSRRARWYLTLCDACRSEQGFEPATQH